MTDLEMTKLCAEVMGYQVGELAYPKEGEVWLISGKDKQGVNLFTLYDPLHDDAQAMALVKKMELDISHCEPSGWIVFSGDGDGIDATAESLNRAIVKCVAKRQLAKDGK